MSSKSHELPVLVVGAGPTGLTLASELLRYGVACRVIDKLETPSDKSKALAIHARTLEILENMNLVDKMIAAGNLAHGFSVYAGKQRLVHVSTEELDSPYPYILMIPQNTIERVLVEQFESLGGEVERGVELLSTSQDEQGVTARIKHLDGREEVVTSQWLVGCDGAHSTVRKGLGLSFEGAAYEERFALADVFLESHLPDDEVSTFFHEEGACVFFPMGNKRFRVLGNIEERAIEGDAPSLEFMQKLAETRCPGVRLKDPIWLAYFKIHRRAVPKYRVGRAFVGGDAAHIHSPVGGQGMNTGMQDVYNLAWKLAFVVRGLADEKLLDSYQQERHPVAQELLMGTDFATKVTVLRNPVAKHVRNNIMAFLSQQEVILQRVRRVGTMMTVNYRKSPIVDEYREMSNIKLHCNKEAESPTLPSWMEFARAPLPGDRAPDETLLDTQKNEVRLFEAIKGTRFSLILFDGKPTEEGYRNVEAIAKTIEERFGETVSSHLIVAGDKVPPSLTFAGKVWLDPDLTAHRAYGAGTESLYLIRPDGYIGFRSQPAKAEPLEQHLAKLLKAKVEVGT